MTITTVSVLCDVGLPDNSEFTASRLDFTLSGPDYDTVSNDSIPAATVSALLSSVGTGTALLWPVDRGTRNTFYNVTLIGSRTVDGRVSAQSFPLGRIAPPADGSPHDLADLLAQSSGSIAAGSEIYATLADAVAAAVAAAAIAEEAAAAGADPIAALAARDEAVEAADFCRSLAFQQAFSFDTVAGQQFYPLAFDPGQQMLILDKNGNLQTPVTDYTITAVSGVIGVQFVDDVLYSGDRITYRVSRAIEYDPNVNRIEGFHSRADLVAHIAAEGAIDGQTYTAGGLFYLGQALATDIPDLPGLVPAGVPTPQHFGNITFGSIDNLATMDAATDATAAIAAMFAYRPFGSSAQEMTYRIPAGVYAVTDLMLSNVTRLNIIAENAVFYGISTTAKDQFLHFHNVHRFTVTGRLRLTSDGNRATPLYSTNYGCALRITSNTDAGSGSTLPLGTSPSSFWDWDNLEITMFENGIVSGYDIGEPAHHREGQDHIIFKNALFRSVMVPFYQNIENSGIQFIGGNLVPQQFSASSAWWSDANSYLFRNDAGRVTFTGGWMQKAVASGFGMYGQNFALYGVTLECAANNYLTGGNITLSGTDRGFVAGLTGPCFTVATGATGQVNILGGGEFRRITEANIASDTPPGSSVLFFDAKDAPDYEINISETKIFEFYFEPLAGVSNRHFVRGGRLRLSNVKIQNTSGFRSYDFPYDSTLQITTADVDGDSMSATADLTAKGGWSVTGLTGGNFQKITSDLPPGKTAAIAMESVGSTGSISTPSGASGFRVKPNTDYMFPMWYKQLTGGGYLSVSCTFYNYAGTTIGSNVSLWGRTNSEAITDNLDEWNRVNIPMKAPAGAHFARINVNATNAAVRGAFSGVGS